MPIFEIHFAEWVVFAGKQNKEKNQNGNMGTKYKNIEDKYNERTLFC